ncbi:MAG: proline--tRNA ligase [Sedimentisphaerales bacterium]
MRYSRIFVPTIKEVPADAEIISHQLLLRAGMMRKVASGTYTYLLLGWRSLLKIMNIVREEMDATGAQEIMMPSLQPWELWHRTGRDVDYGETMCHLTDRHGRENVLGPTAEEVVTFLAANEISSYKQLPFNLYQISPKFRDEFRPRFGPIRSREFIMKDAYSFHDSPESLHETYMAMYNAYCRIFTRCGLEYVIVEAEVGEMGGSGSHQFTVPCESGEDTIVYTQDGSYAANLERASVDSLPKQEASEEITAMQEVYTPHVGSIEAVCDFLKTKPEDMIKTLIYSKGEQTIAALIRGDHDVNEEKLGIAAGGGKIELADEATIVRISNANVGFAGPVGMVETVDKMIID